MAFSILCSNKGCGNLMEPYIDPFNDKVYCSSCDKEITNVTYFVKMQLKSSKQFRPKKTIAYAVKCKNCSKEDVPKLQEDKFICPGCNKQHTNLSEPFKIILREKLKKPSQDI